MSPEDFAALGGSEDCAYVLSADLRLVRTNAGWSAFALENGGSDVLERWPLGASIENALPDSMREFYVSGYRRAITTGTVWEHEYECSSPERYRRLRMMTYPMPSGELLVVHATIVDQPHDRAPHADPQDYLQEGLLTMCAHCRRVRDPKAPTRWHWVPAFVAKMPDRMSHGLCPPCLEFYFPPQ